MNEPKFYCLLPPLVLQAQPEPKAAYRRPEWETVYGAADVKDIKYESIICSLVPAHRRAGARIGDPHLITSSPFGDFIWTYMSECVVTDHVMSFFREEHLKGFNPRSASIASASGGRTRNTGSIPKVWELEVQGKGGNTHPDSGIHLLYVCPECGYTVYSSFQNGIIMDKDQWDGSDFFTVNGYPKHIIITEKVKDLIIRKQFTNCAIFRSEDLRWGNLPRPEQRPELFVAKHST